MLTGKEQYSYFGYGLQIDSCLPLTELPSGAGAPDVRVRLGSLAHFQFEDGRPAVANERELCRRWEHVGTFLARDGGEIVVDPVPHVETRSLSPFITGPMMACLLHQRGRLVLHASALVCRRRGIGFLADSGAGKSTLAAFLQSRGAPLIADDIVPVEFGADGAETVPGYPQIRLWEDSLASLGVEAGPLARVNQFIDKRFYPIETAAAPRVRLDALYVIAEGPEIKIERLRPADAFFEIARNAYLKRYVEATGRTAAHFAQCRQLTGAAKIFKLERPRDFRALTAVAEALEAHAEQL